MIRERLHTLTHRVPGVPEHDGRHNVDARSRRPGAADRHQGSANRLRHSPAEPRVLVRWQRWIASLARSRVSS
jgi:hypothetical protein